MNLKSIISVLSPTSFWRFSNFSGDNVYDEYSNNILVNYGTNLDQAGSSNANLSDKSTNLNGGYLDSSATLLSDDLNSENLIITFNFRCPEEIIGTKPIISKWHPNQIFFLGFENGILVIKVRTDTELLEVNMSNKEVLYNNRWNNVSFKIRNGTVTLDVNGTSQRDHGNYSIPITGNVYSDTVSPFRVGGEGSESFTQDFFITDIAITQAQDNDVEPLYVLTRDIEDRFLDLAPDYYFNLTEAIVANTKGVVTNKGTKGSHIKGYLKGNDISTFVLRNDTTLQSLKTMPEFITGSYFTIDDILTCDFTGDQTTSIIMDTSHNGDSLVSAKTLIPFIVTNQNDEWLMKSYIYSNSNDPMFYLTLNDGGGAELQNNSTNSSNLTPWGNGLMCLKFGFNGTNSFHLNEMQSTSSTFDFDFPVFDSGYIPSSTQTFIENKFFYNQDWSDAYTNPCMGQIALFSRKISNSEELELNYPEISAYGSLISGLPNVSDYGWKSGYTDLSEESRRLYSKTELNLENTNVGYTVSQQNDLLTNRLNLWNGSFRLPTTSDYISTPINTGIGNLDFVYNYFINNKNTTASYTNVQFENAGTKHLSIELNQKDGSFSLGDIEIAMEGDMTYAFSTTSQKIIDDGYHMITLVRIDDLFELYIDGILETSGTTPSLHNIDIACSLQHYGGDCYLNDITILLDTTTFNYTSFIEYAYQGYHININATATLSGVGIESKIHTIDSDTLLQSQTTLSDINGNFNITLPKSGNSKGKYLMAVPVDENATPIVVVHGIYQTSATFDQL